MKNLKSTALGFVAGALCVGSFSYATAASADKIAVASLMENVSFKVDGQVKYPPLANMPLNYNGQTYVPVRYLSELLGCTVEWNGYNDCVIINYPEDRIKTVVEQKEVEKIVYVEKGESPSGTVHAELPISASRLNYTLTMRGLNRDSGSNVTRVYLKLENDGREGVQLMPDECLITIDDKNYKPSKISYNQDSGWYNNVKKDDDYQGFVGIDITPTNFKYGTFKAVVRATVDGKTETYTHTFNFINPNPDDDDE